VRSPGLTTGGRRELPPTRGTAPYGIKSRGGGKEFPPLPPPSQGRARDGDIPESGLDGGGYSGPLDRGAVASRIDRTTAPERGLDTRVCGAGARGAIGMGGFDPPPPTRCPGARGARIGGYDRPGGTNSGFGQVGGRTGAARVAAPTDPSVSSASE